MKITVELDNGDSIIYDKVDDAYLSVRQRRTVGTPSGAVYEEPVVRSSSWGANLRELVKEVTQSLGELQDILREQRDARSSQCDNRVAGNGSVDPKRLVPRIVPR